MLAVESRRTRHIEEISSYQYAERGNHDQITETEPPPEALRMVSILIGDNNEVDLI